MVTIVKTEETMVQGSKMMNLRPHCEVDVLEKKMKFERAKRSILFILQESFLNVSTPHKFKGTK